MKQVAYELAANATSTVVALRGEHLCLTRQLWFPADQKRGGFEYELVVVYELNEQGLIAAQVIFEPDNLDEAFADLDARFAAGEGSTHTAALQVVSRLREVINQREPDGLRAVFTDDFELVDHRPASLGRMDGDAYAASIQEMWRIVPLRNDVVMYHEMTEERVLAEMLNRGVTAEGASIETAFQMIIEIREGRVSRLEPFPVEAIDAARARFASSPDSEKVHPCLRFHELRSRYMAAGEWEAAAALYSDEVAFEDRRSGLRTRLEGKVAIIEHARVAARGTEMQASLVATRGDRLALMRGLISTGREYEVELLLLHELDEDGRLVLNMLFDADDTEEAMAELDERYRSGEGAPHADVVSLLSAFMSTMNARDWQELSELFVPDARVVDHTPAGRGDMSVQQFIESLQALVDLTTEMFGSVTEFHDFADGLSLVDAHNFGLSLDGAEVDIAYQMVAEYRNGRFAHIDLFPRERLDLARARFKQLRDSSPLGSRTIAARPFSNQCTQMLERLRAIFESQDWARLAGLFADEFPGGSDGAVSFMRSLYEVGGLYVKVDPIALRGETLALARFTIRGELDTFETRVLCLYEINEDRRIVSWTVFDSDEEDQALAALDERYAAGRGRTVCGGHRSEPSRRPRE